MCREPRIVFLRRRLKRMSLSSAPQYIIPVIYSVCSRGKEIPLPRGDIPDCGNGKFADARRNKINRYKMRVGVSCRFR